MAPGAALGAAILLTHGYSLAEDPHEQAVMKPYPPLGLLCLSAYLKQQGLHAEILDGTFLPSSALLDAIRARPAPVLGIYTNLMTRPAVLRQIAAGKEAGMCVVLGGPEAANHVEAYLAQGADYIVLGEGELTLVALLRHLRDAPHEPPRAIAGLCFLDQGQVLRTPPRPALRQLDLLPWPDRSAIDLSAYLDCWREHHGRSSLNLITARGCPYRCRWCSHAVFGHGHARRSPDDVAAELAHLVEAFNPDQVWYADDVFTISGPWIKRYRRSLAARDLRVPFECITRADCLDEGLADDLAAMGCFRVWLGSESGSQRILDAMERGVTVAELRRATGWLQARGIEVGMFFMWGYPGEEAADIQATVEHVVACMPDQVLSTVAYPIAGTPFHAEVHDRILPLKPWAEGSDRAQALAGRPSRRYYAAASRWLKAAHRLHGLRLAGRGHSAAALRAGLAVARARWDLRRYARDVDAPA